MNELTMKIKADLDEDLREEIKVIVREILEEEKKKVKTYDVINKTWK